MIYYKLDGASQNGIDINGNEIKINSCEILSIEKKKFLIKFIGYKYLRRENGEYVFIHKSILDRYFIKIKKEIYRL